MLKAAVIALPLLLKRPRPAPAPYWADAQPGWWSGVLRGLEAELYRSTQPERGSAALAGTLPDPMSGATRPSSASRRPSWRVSVADAVVWLALFVLLALAAPRSSGNSEARGPA